MDTYEPLTQKYDGWARADTKGLSRLRRPLPGEVDGDLSLLVGLHATDEKGLRGILETGRLLPGIASEGEYVFMKGYLAYEGNQRHNDEEAQRVLDRMREKSNKHACGVIIEVSMFGIHKTCKTVAQEWVWAGKPDCFTCHRENNKGSRWTMPSANALVRALWLDLKWHW